MKTEVKKKNTKRKIKTIIKDLNEWHRHFEHASEYFTAQGMDVLACNMRGHVSEIEKAIKAISYLSR